MRHRFRSRLAMAIASVMLVGTGWLVWKAEDSGWFWHRQLEGVTGVADAGPWRYGGWARLQPDLDQDEVRAAMAGLARAAEGHGVVAVAAASTPSDAEGVPVSYVEIGPLTDLEGLPATLEAIAGLTGGLDVENASARYLGEGLLLEVSADGTPADLPVVAGVIVEAVRSAGADRVSTAVISVGKDGNAGTLRVSCDGGLAGVADRLALLTRAQGPGWLVGTAVDCQSPVVTEFLVQDAEDLAPQRRRAARILPADWQLSAAWNGGIVAGRADLGLDPGSLLQALRERDGATLGPLTADLSHIELTVPDLESLRRVVRRLTDAGASRVEASLGQMRIEGPVAEVRSRLPDLARLEQLGWHPGYTMLRDGSEVWSVAEDDADLFDAADRQALAKAWRDVAGGGVGRYILERPNEDDLLLPLLVFESSAGGTAEVEADLAVLQGNDSEQIREAFLETWDVTAGSSDP